MSSVVSKIDQTKKPRYGREIKRIDTVCTEQPNATPLIVGQQKIEKTRNPINLLCSRDTAEKESSVWSNNDISSIVKNEMIIPTLERINQATEVMVHRNQVVEPPIGKDQYKKLTQQSRDKNYTQ